MRRLRREESGFSLIELLAAMAVSAVILTAVMTIFVNGVQGAAKVTDRVDAQQRARLALDRMTTLLSSQVCINAATAPIIAGSSNTSVTFYADIDPTRVTTIAPMKVQFAYDSTAHTLTESRWYATSAVTGAVPTYGAAAKVSQIAQNVFPALDTGGNPLPVFSYYRFQPDGTVNLANPIAASGGLAAADSDDVVEVAVNFAVTPARTNTTDARQTAISGQALAGSANPASPSAGPNCQ